MVSGLIPETYALFRLALASAPRFPLNLASEINSPVHSSIGTPSHIYSASTACKHRVSGSISLRSRGSFHLSLTVLCAIGRSVVFCLGWWSTLLPTRFHVSRGTLDTSPSALDFVYRSFTVCAQSSQIVRLSLTDLMLVLNPGRPKTSCLGSSLFARRY